MPCQTNSAVRDLRKDPSSARPPRPSSPPSFPPHAFASAALRSPSRPASITNPRKQKRNMDRYATGPAVHYLVQERWDNDRAHGHAGQVLATRFVPISSYVLSRAGHPIRHAHPQLRIRPIEHGWQHPMLYVDEAEPSESLHVAAI